MDLETARAARGLRLVLITALPSPWSEGARAIFSLKGLDALAVRFRPGDVDLASWTGSPNAPVVLLDSEPPRTGWAEIIALGERLSGTPALVPADAPGRTRLFAWLRELLDPSGLAAARRTLVLHESLRPDEPGRSRCGFPVDLARTLADRYGYLPGHVPEARRKLIEGLGRLDALLAESAATGGRYLLGALTALDLYVAATTATLVPQPNDAHPILPALRPALSFLDPEVRSAVSEALLAHRDFIYARHIHAPPAVGRAGGSG